LPRYSPKWLLAGLAGTVASLAVFASAAAPTAGATQVTTCTRIAQFPYIECTTTSVLSKLSVKLKKQMVGYKVTIKIGDPSISLNVKLFRNGKFVRTSFNGTVNPGTKILHIHPTKPGRWRLQVKGSEGGVTLTRNKKFKVT
jgi:hypothetical protein